MAEIDINDVAALGAVRDTPAYMLPPEAWTLAENMRIVDGGMEVMDGWSEVFDVPAYAPHFAIPLNTSSQTFWLYVSLTKAAVYSGGGHTDITRLSGDYNAGDTRNWNAALLGSVPIINNGVDVPQWWPTASPGVRLADLPNWGAATELGSPPTTRAKVLRAFGPYLFAFHVTDTLGVHPHTFHWSHPAESGGIPVSWDYTDTDRSSRRFDLEDVSTGVILDALRLQSALYIYKEAATWRCTFVGGLKIFDLQPFLATVGLLAPRCVTNVMAADGPRHVLATQDDIIWHNGNILRSVLNERQKRRLFADIDSQNFVNSFMFDNAPKSEAWFCYPTSGNTHPNRALVMNYGKEPWRVTTADGINFRNVAVGTVETSSGEIWDTGSDLWDDDTGPWSQVSRRKLVLSNPDASRFYQMDSGKLRGSVAFVGTLRREGLALLGKKRDGSWIVDFQRIKMIDRLWPKIQRGPVNIRVGVQDVVEGAVSFNAPVVFDPSIGVFSDPALPKSGRAIALEISGSDFRLDGYKINVEDVGEF
jgi:hypothetical protein